MHYELASVSNVNAYVEKYAPCWSNNFRFMGALFYILITCSLNTCNICEQIDVPVLLHIKIKIKIKINKSEIIWRPPYIHDNAFCII